ncbi:uncharacterized protein B0I36DRAFT_340873 [Microdochium trichocladiopsis]|uniref:Uncharacterized protein n=1 Tax=Microdochium trichocladiopsis TaxID=1682393 RepID=A0A9P8XR60_9PEZI|nr:uncharacterized protein B0I36DRAFT_340873 [Microdochium trichocladiopsis]KAH7012296.1 hypothetical protein B0I36DRAFT_340873 [Microdochium trichocladiopsis]
MAAVAAVVVAVAVMGIRPRITLVGSAAIMYWSSRMSVVGCSTTALCRVITTTALGRNVRVFSTTRHSTKTITTALTEIPLLSMKRAKHMTSSSQLPALGNRRRNKRSGTATPSVQPSGHGSTSRGRA